MYFPTHSKARGFTLLELLIALGVATVVGLIIFSALSSTLNLYAKNFSINESHGRARAISERLKQQIHNAVEPPTLVDSKGSPIAGNGPAPGITCFVYASEKPFYTSNAINQNTNAIQINKVPRDQPTPLAGDFILMPMVTGVAYENNGSLLAEISSVEVVGSGNLKLNFTNALSTYFTPQLKEKDNLNPNQPFYLLSKGAFIAVGGNGSTSLRYYPRAKNVARDGKAFDEEKNPDGTINFKVLAELVPLPAEVNCNPFSYQAIDRRTLDVSIRSVSTRFKKRVNSFNFFDSYHTKIAYRSATHKTLQP